jgi:hypothetical protein
MQAKTGSLRSLSLLGGLRLGVLLLPTFLMALGFARSAPSSAQLYLAGGGIQLLFAAYLVLYQQAWRQPLRPVVIVPYLVAFCWTFVADELSSAWYLPLARGALLMVPLTVFAIQTLRDTGAVAGRKARLLTQRLANRTDWPSDPAEIRLLPEVRMLRDLIVQDATPALALLQHAKMPVRLAALSALESRRLWKYGQPELVFRAAQDAREPAIRAAAIRALARIDDRRTIELLGEYLRDPVPEVRQAAADTLLADTSERWQWLRHCVRRALADAALQADGALRYDGLPLSVEAVNDLLAWCGEKGSLGIRAAMTLGWHYRRVLGEVPDPEVLQTCKQLVRDPRTASALRIELAHLLKQAGELDAALLQELLSAANPAPLRLTAAEALLVQDSRHPEAVDALREIAKLPNREIALGTADVVQRCLGIDLGLALGQPLPPAHSRQAAEITRRVMLWATSGSADPLGATPRSTMAGPGSGSLRL